MGLQEVYIMVTTLLLVTGYSETTAANVQAELDVGSENSELLQMIFKQIEKLGNRDHAEETTLSKGHTELASALLQVAPVITIKGNITDSSRSLTVTFTVQVSQQSLSSSSGKEAEDEDDDEDDDDWDYNWRGSGGLLHPIVGVMEPYVLGFAEVVFNGILSTIIGNFLSGSAMLGDVKLV